MEDKVVIRRDEGGWRERVGKWKQERIVMLLRQS